MKKVLIFYGPPGAGKGTQANLISNKIGMIHFDTGKYIEQVVHNPENLKNKKIQEEKKLFDDGKLCTPSWVFKIVKDKTDSLANAGFGVIFSGSPRTMYEAFGDKKTEGHFSILERRFGKKNIHVFYLKIHPRVSIFRNSHRRVCSTCGVMLATTVYRGRLCPLCRSPLHRRTLDVPRVIKVRLKEYNERTAPIIEELKKRHYKLYVLNGEDQPYRVMKQILKILHYHSD